MIRHAQPQDLDRIMELYDISRNSMRRDGNKNQWINGFPQRELIEEDIRLKRNYVEEFENPDGTKTVTGVFAFILGEDHTYLEIEGKWQNNNPYGTIHRIGSDGTHAGFLSRVLEFCKPFISTIRIDTHADNKRMQHLVTKYGFTYCGIIHVDDGSPRLAYQLN